MDGTKLISTENYGLNAANTMIDHYNLQQQLNYTDNRDSPTIGVSNVAKMTSASIASSRLSLTISESTPMAAGDDTNASQTTTMRVATENINNNNNNSSHNNNSSFSNVLTITGTSSANDHKYLHKKFKRVASTTSENSSLTISNAAEDSDQSDNRLLQKQSQISDDSDLNNRSNIACSKVTNRLEKDHVVNRDLLAGSDGTKALHLRLEVVKEHNNRLIDNEEPAGSSYAIVNGCGRLTPQFQTVETISIADTGYGSDGELKSATTSGSVAYKVGDTAAQSILSANHHTVNNHALNRMPQTLSVGAPSRNSPSVSSSETSTFRNAGNYESMQNSSKLPLASQQSSHMPSPHSPQSQQQLQSQQQQRLHVRNDLQQLQQQQQVVVDQNNSGRHSCPFCNLNCTKPSVLQKHIRTHTNERPYRCDKCCFAFKTKSNYYKHCRSRSHTLRVKGIEPQPEDENSIGSDPDPDPDVSNSSSDILSRTASPLDERTCSPAIQFQTGANTAVVAGNQQHTKYSVDKPYKPKFHNAALYTKEEYTANQQKHQQQILQFQQHQQQQILHQSPQISQQMPHQPAQQSHQTQLNSYRTSQNSHPSRIQHQETDIPIYFQQQQHQTQHQSHQQQQSTKNPIEYPTQRIQTTQATPIRQMSTSVVATSFAADHSARESTNTSSIPTLGRSLSGGIGGHQLNVEAHISYLISRNEAIVNKELPLQKKYPKVSSKSKNATIMSNTNSKLAYTLNNKQQQQQQAHQHQQLTQQQPNLLTVSTNGLPAVNAPLQKIAVHSQQPQVAPLQIQQQQVQQPTEPGSTTTQPLNLSKVSEQVDLSRKRVPSDNFTSASVSESSASTSSNKNMSHPQNPERSIIKHLLLNARGQTVPSGAGDEETYTCVLCKMEFHSSEDLRCHVIHYCQGGPSSAPMSPVGSSSFKYSRSNSISVNLPELNNPNSLAKLARSKLLLSQNPRSLAKLAWSQLKTKPSNLVLTQLSVNTNSTPTSSNIQPNTSSSNTPQKLTETPLPSPGPLLGKTPLVEAYNNSERKSDDVIIMKMHEENRQFLKSSSPKRLKFDGYPQPIVTSSPNTAVAMDVPGPSHVTRMFSMCGGDVTPLEKKDEPMKRFFSSGGCIIPLSECPDLENSPKIIRTPLFSGGSFTEISPKPAVPQTPKVIMPIPPPNITPGVPAPIINAANLTRFQFPPINSITAFNPLTLPPVSVSAVLPASVSHGDKIIPFVPGIPGPNSLAAQHMTLQPPKAIDRMELNRNLSPNRKKTPSPLVQPGLLYSTQKQSTSRVEDESERSMEFFPTQRSPRSWVPPVEPPPKKSFNFTRIADNLSPRKTPAEKPAKSPEPVRHFNFDKLEKSRNECSSTTSQMMPLHVDVSSSSSSREREQLNVTCAASNTPEAKIGTKSKFLRPTSLPLKPGTFTPKCHHGITPTANTLPLISPETPRPSKACVQLYLNGHAYTYLGLKSSTKMFYCTVNCPQPSYIANMNRLSMYSVWQVCAENNPHPLGLKPKAVMSLYDSRQRNLSFSTATIKCTVKTVRSQPTVMTPFENNNGQFYYHQIKSLPEQPTKGDGNQKCGSSSNNRLVGGYESNENYTYVRGRGRGRYVCSECGIRCKKPSMLKKHIRTHTDVRPYTCQHCSFSFKTKGNLTKHMQSKTHYKKCLELGINLGPMPEGEFNENEFDTDQQSINSGGGRTSSVPGESDSDEYSDGNEGETESSDTDESKSRLAEHEAARSLLSLSMTPPSNQAAISPNPFNQQQQKIQYSAYRDQQQTHQFIDGAFQNVSGRRSSDEPLQTQNRRVISFTSPKPPFDYQKQEQYFSNPSLSLKPTRTEDTAMKPIDLTKPRKMDHARSILIPTPPRIAEFVCEVSSESGLIKSLVSNTDKIRPTMEHSFIQDAVKFNENVQLQAYLTEQALRYTKIKQSQMNKTFSSVPPLVTSSPASSPSIPIITITDVSKANTLSMSYNEEINTTTVTTSSYVCQPITSPTIPRISAPNTMTAESESSTSCVSVSTSNTVLDNRIENGEVESPSEEAQETLGTASSKLSATPSTSSAKSVASEYLKMTSAESRINRAEESEDSCSDQELSTAEMGPKPASDFTGIVPPTVIVGEDGFKSSNEVQPMFRVHLSDDGRPVCKICSKTFQKHHQMALHMNIHYMERKFKCEPCAVSFRTQGHLQKHERSEAHKNKVMMNSTFGVPTTSNPRPFECSDCKVAFRIHGHLAKHLRSKTHVQKLECLQKLPFGTYAEIERAGISLTEIDTTDCDNSLASLRELAQRLIEKDPTKMGTYTKPSCIDGGTNSHESGSEDSPEALPLPNDATDASPGLSSSHGLSGTGSTSSVDSPGGMKRKFDSFSSCSNDSTSNVTSQATVATSDGTSEKRVRTNSDP
ncbi:uncharacterized protein LOC119659519 isoform X2 [Hermetia illucens]|nr:uncharacterized protein LOC119659519 isoform X2 [Hermetia illucens]XP_037923580.1 uncharacterized protein LOC119659519 isoform X2 [Hermetia illucens]XP_037923581.1 uncharacterized protein LOC119659519 isoform X2 [Hermetia illucens]XP_037923582.1 uncharacterized protein LOC119659519 isoform X2 [Hermetia illucens]